MDCVLKTGYHFSLEGVSGTFVIRGLMGRGASCVVYLADHTDAEGICTEHVLKEYAPRDVELLRDETGTLHPLNAKENERFFRGMERFRAGAKIQLSLRREADARNTTSQLEGIYKGNGTLYLSMPCFSGVAYDQVEETNLYQLLQRIRAITGTVASYHRHGYLHLDIKPENVFALPETAELVLLFDFDSVVRIEEAADGMGVLSCTKTWAAPEQLLPGRRNRICQATDLFAIGEILFFKLMGRHSTRAERRSFARFSYDPSNALFSHLNPKVFPLLSEIFHHTICAEVSQRYTSAEELLATLDQILPLADPSKPYLAGNLPPALPEFVGREAEQAMIQHRLTCNGKLFLSGIGGIGKSELAKQYAAQYPDVYETVLFAHCSDGLEMALADDREVPIARVSRYEGEHLTDYARRKLRLLRELADSRTLLILDNVNDLEDPLLPEILRLGCPVLVTTRTDAAAFEQPQLTVEPLASLAEIETVFRNNCRRIWEESAWDAIRELIALVDGHTMAVALLAKQLQASGLEPTELLKRMQNDGLSDSGREKVSAAKDGVLIRQSAFQHIRALFNVAKLDMESQTVLMNMALLPDAGVSRRQMQIWCKWPDFEALNQLIESGWIRENRKGQISLHPLIAEVAMEQLREEPEASATFLTELRAELQAQLRNDRSGLSPARKKADPLVVRAIGERLLRSKIATQAAAWLLDIIPFTLAGYGFLDMRIRCRLRALKILEPIYGSISSITARELHNIALLYHVAGNLDTAELYHQKAFDIRKVIPNCSQRDLAESEYNLGSLYLERGNLNQAEQFYKQALEYYQAKNDVSCCKAVLNSLGVLNKKRGSRSAARDYYYMALELFPGGKNTSEPSAVGTLINLGQLDILDGRFQSAEALLLRALEICENQYGEDYSLTMKV